MNGFLNESAFRDALQHVTIKARLYQLRKPSSGPAEFPAFDETNQGRFLRSLGA